MPQEDGDSAPAKWQRREQRRTRARERMQKHGATLRRVYADAVLKRLRKAARVRR
ncbi:MAG TPA: hypothetical protein VFX19_12780 [Dehalococcoidia bacterium]|nr:hypothetical protein [Dehalococcoidia bacterium]